MSFYGYSMKNGYSSYYPKDYDLVVRPFKTIKIK